MGFNDFWINNNGKKEHLNNAKHGVRKEQVDKKFHNLFDAYDANGDGTLETEELGGVFKGLTKFAGADKTLDATENKQVAGLFANQAGIEDADFMGFVRSVSKATEDIVDSKETPTADGGREVTTTYKDGSVETISYYPDGEYKFKKLDQKGNNESYYIIGNNDRHFTAQEIENQLKTNYDKYLSNFKPGENKKPMAYQEFKTNSMSKFNIRKINSDFERHNLDLSERAKKDIEVRDFVLNHYVETHKAAQEALESMGILDDVGAAINAGAGELWNSIKNVWNGTEEEYQNFYELSKKFEPSYNKALRTDGSLDVMRNNPEMFFRGFETDFKKDMGHKYNLENSIQFQQTAEQYQNAQILKQRIDILNKAMQEIKEYQAEKYQQNSAMPEDKLNPYEHINNANKLLLEYFGGDKEAVDLVLNGTLDDAEATIKAISGIKEDTEKLNASVLGGKSFDEIQSDYKSQYKAMYGTEFVPDELTEKVMDAQATGGMVKLGAITIVSILITKSPVMQGMLNELRLLTLTETGADVKTLAAARNLIIQGGENSIKAAKFVETLSAKYGTEAVAQGIKLAMTSGTLATDVGLTLINQATSERGVNGEELWESTKGSAKYIFFGAYVGAPLAQAVSRSLGKIGATARLFEGGTKTANGAIQTTSISGDKLIQNFVKGGNKVLAKGGAFLTEVGAFAGLDVVGGEMDIAEAIKEQGSFLPKLKLMNHVLEYMLGAKAHTATSRANLDAAIEKSGVKNWNIKEIKTPQKTQYIVDIDGLPVGKFEDANQLATAMLERVTANYDETAVPEIKTEIAKSLKKGEPKSEITRPQGMNAQEDALIQKARKENPATVVEEKVRKQWQQHDIETTASDEKVDLFNLDPNTGLKESAQNVENEVTSLIFKGKLNETLTQRYNEMGKVFTEIAKKHSADIEQLAKQNPKDKQAVADGIVKILAQELGMEGFEPPIVFENTNGGDGFADWPNGRIVINKDITNVKKLTSMISHEFVHMLQYRDILAQYGEQGLRDLIANDKSIPENEKEQHIQKALNNPYNQHLLQSYDFQKAQTGTVNDYLRRIYKDEFTNTVGTDNMPEYVNQATERGAYSSQEKVDRGLDESNLGELSVGEYVPNDASLAALRAKMKAKLQAGQDVSSNNSLNRTSEHTEDIEINSDGTVTRKGVPAGISDSELTEVARIRRGIDNFEQSLERVNNNEMVSVEDFTDVLKSILSGEESERESFADRIMQKLPATNGQVPSKAIELVKLIKENYKDNFGDTNSSIEQILSAATSHFDRFSQTMVGKRLTNEQVDEMIEYIKTLKTNNSLTPPSYNLFDAMKFAKDINGDFSAKQIFELYKKGLTITDIDKMYNESYEYGDTNYAAYSVRLELAKYADISPEVETFLKNKILNNGVRRSDSQYKYEVERLLNNFKSNDINTISLLERAFKDGYLGDNLPINRVIDFPVSDLQIAMYDLLPKPNDINLGIRLFKTLKNVNQANAKIFEKVMEQARAMDDPGRIEYSVLIDVLEKIQDQNDANLIAKGIENKLFDTTNGFEIWQMKHFVEHMENHPEVVREWVENSINFEHIGMDGFGEFINGRESNGEKPLTEEQRKLVYEVIKYRDENGYPNMNWTSSTRTALLELSPKYYELIKNSVIGTNKDFCSTAEFINKCAKNQPEVLENLEKDISNNPKLLKYFGLEAIAKHKDKVELFIEHEDLLKSFQESGNEDIGAIFEQVGFDVLKEGMSILKDVPEEVKTKFKDALAKLYVVEIANKIGMVPFKSDLMLEVYKKAVNYEDDVAETLIKTLWQEMGDGLKHIELSNLDFVANYIKSKDHPDRTYIIKVLNSSEDIGKNTATLTEMLENKDKLLKQVAMRCQNTNPEFVKFVEEYLNSEDAYDLVFMPNLSINTLANNFFEVSKIFQYVNTKPQDYINGHYDEKIINALKDYRKKDSERTLFNSLSEEDRATVEQINNTINQNIDNRFSQILDAISSTDIETVKLLLDKRFSIFQDKMSEINELSGAAKVILSDVIRNGKRINKNGQPDKLTGQQKIDMINLIKCATSIIENFDINNYKTPLKKGAFILDSDRLHDDIFKAILSKKGLSQEEINKLKPENLNWNMKYLSLLFNTPGRDEGELADVVKAASMGDFNEFINDVNNKYGQTNLQTRQAFESNGVNYEQWLRPNVADVEFEVAGKQCHIRMWDRNPQEDMFLGSKTSCCTALDRTNGGSMAVYMLNTSYNVVELYDAKGEVVGMSRIFMAKVDGKPTLIMDNIELNHEFIKGMDHNVEVKEIRDNFFKYMNTYAEKITGDPNAQVLFYSGDIHVPNGDLTRVDNTIDFLGGIHREEVYVNAVHCSYHNPTKLKDVGNITWLKVPKE